MRVIVVLLFTLASEAQLASAACSTARSIRMENQVDQLRSGGMCVCPSNPDERCPPKGQTCGIAKDTLPNYYKQVTNGDLNPAVCRDKLKSNSSSPCHMWCAQQCDNDKDCVMWNFHDKYGGKCELYNHTDVLFNAPCGPGYCNWPETAIGCSTKGVATKPADCCPECSVDLSYKVGVCADDNESPAVKRTHKDDKVLLAADCSKYCEADPTCYAWSLVPSTVPDSLRIYQGCYMMNSSWNGKRDACPYASDSSGCSSRGVARNYNTCCYKSSSDVESMYV